MFIYSVLPAKFRDSFPQSMKPCKLSLQLMVILAFAEDVSLMAFSVSQTTPVWL
jgi:hypothetical protein